MPFAPYSYVDLNFNLFEGSIPLFCGVTTLALRHNLFSGSIPVNFSPDMCYLDLSENHLNGSIPSSINKLESLQVLFVEKDQLSGKILSWKRLKNLEALDLSNNNLSGHIPSSLCLQSVLSHLKLSYNNLHGNLSSLQSCTSMRELSLAYNQFSGGIPTWIGENLHRLGILQLRENMFEGKIPENLCFLSNLHALDLGQNNLSGPIPSCLSNLSSLHQLENDPFRGTNFKDDMEFNVKGQTLEFILILDLVNLIDLSSNNLERVIPEGIMKLFALGNLNLSRNQLTGNIPKKIGALHLLETLDLSVNHLSGPIPASMLSMTLLSHLNLSHNDLFGPIPSENQFLTFNNPSIYEGNPKLCGAPLPTNCSTHKNDTPDGNTGKDKDENGFEKKWFYIGVAFGFSLGFWAVYGTLVIKRSWRHAYLRGRNEG